MKFVILIDEKHPDGKIIAKKLRDYDKSCEYPYGFEADFIDVVSSLLEDKIGEFNSEGICFDLKIHRRKRK